MLMITVPHSGETIPPEATWLQTVDPLVVLTDVDRFVHELYGPVAQRLGLPFVVAAFHRYAVDLNRLPTDIDSSLVEGAAAPSEKGGFVSGFHWARTTKGVPLMAAPLTRDLHELLTKKYHDQFHQDVARAEAKILAQGGLPRFHIDAHSMPSQGTGAHRDNGARRPDIVVSDCSGKSCAPAYKDAVIKAYENQGFSVAYNWPYLGGRMTEQYGRPQQGQHTVQVELNRALYMNETTREKNEFFEDTSQRIAKAVAEISLHCADALFRKALTL